VRFGIKYYFMVGFLLRFSLGPLFLTCHCVARVREQ